jgi:hypothetical protein
MILQQNAADAVSEKITVIIEAKRRCLTLTVAAQY